MFVRYDGASTVTYSLWYWPTWNFLFILYLIIRPSSLMDLLSLRLVEVVGTIGIMWGAYSHRRCSVWLTCTRAGIYQSWAKRAEFPVSTRSFVYCFLRCLHYILFCDGDGQARRFLKFSVNSHLVGLYDNYRGSLAITSPVWDLGNSNLRFP